MDRLQVNPTDRFTGEECTLLRLYPNYFRLTVDGDPAGMVGKVLGLNRLQGLKAVTVRWASDGVSKAIMRHPGIVKVHIRDTLNISRMKNWRTRYNSVLHFSMDEHFSPPAVSKVQELRLSNCFVQCGQLNELLAAISQGHSAIKSLRLNRLGCECPLTHNDCPMSSKLLGQASNKLTHLTLKDISFNRYNLMQEARNFNLEKMFDATEEETSLRELVVASNPHFSFISPSVLTSALVRIESVVLISVDLALQQSLDFFAGLKTHNTGKLRKLRIQYNSYNNRDNNNSVKHVNAALLAEALNNLEHVELQNVNLSSEQATAILDRSLKGTKLKTLRLDRFDADRQHLFVSAKLMAEIPFSFEFNDIQPCVKWHSGLNEELYS